MQVSYVYHVTVRRRGGGFVFLFASEPSLADVVEAISYSFAEVPQIPIRDELIKTVRHWPKVQWDTVTLFYQQEEASNGDEISTDIQDGV